ncbi:hypothetical protein [Pedobacter glucosidilyticus]|uniref:hypothetical protein n=1 Tax=Pedobacter glucosidilyticus TaxID=1122941 RepID=UPI0026F01CF4|nr:hypothetical protein [Pedobacter glucosidilyticus]
MNPTDDNKNYRFGLFYYNQDDPRTIVPRKLRTLGYTMNFARPISYVALILLIIMLVFLVYVLSNVSLDPKGFA